MRIKYKRDYAYGNGGGTNVEVFFVNSVWKKTAGWGMVYGLKAGEQ
jgi:hypothetical protein